MMRIAKLNFGVALAIGMIATGVHAQSAEPAGPSIATRGHISMCIGCHGLPNYRTAYPLVYHVPKIAGQSPEYIVKALQAYRSGERNHPSMRGIARSLSDQDMAALAAYYGGAGK
jgi:cytochrome c553